MNSSVEASGLSVPGRAGGSESATILLEAAAIDRGLTTTRLRPDTFLVEDAEGGLVGFQGRHSTASTHAGIHFCESRIHRSDRLRAAGVPVPRMLIVDAEARAEAESFAAELPGGVVLKSSRRPRSSSSPAVLSAPSPLTQQWDNLTRRLRPGARMLLEEFIDEDEYAFDVVAGRVLAARRLRSGGGRQAESASGSLTALGEQHVAMAFHPQILRLAREAAGVVPPLASLTVRMVCPSPQESAEGCVVLSLIPEANLALADAESSWGSFLAGEIVDAQARELTARRDPSGEPLRLRMEISDVGDPVAMALAVQNELPGRMIHGSLSHTAFREVGGPVEGRPGDLALLSSRVIRGLVYDASPKMVRLTPAP